MDCLSSPIFEAMQRSTQVQVSLPSLGKQIVPSTDDFSATKSTMPFVPFVRVAAQQEYYMLHSYPENAKRGFLEPYREVQNQLHQFTLTHSSGPHCQAASLGIGYI